MIFSYSTILVREHNGLIELRIADERGNPVNMFCAIANEDIRNSIFLEDTYQLLYQIQQCIDSSKMKKLFRLPTYIETLDCDLGGFLVLDMTLLGEGHMESFSLYFGPIQKIRDMRTKMVQFW